MSGRVIESLESRVCMSAGVAGYALGNFDAGTKLTYENVNSAGEGTGSFTLSVGAARTVKHVTTIPLTNASSYTGGSSSFTYSEIASPGGGVALQRLDGVTKAGTATTHTTETFRNPRTEVLYPPTLVPGRTYGYAWTADVTTVTGHHAPQSYSDDATFTVKLRSARRTRISVTAGKFLCYVIDEVTTFRGSDGTVQTTATTQYVCPGIGLIKQADTSYASTAPRQKTSTSVELIAFDLADA